MLKKHLPYRILFVFTALLALNSFTLDGAMVGEASAETPNAVVNTILTKMKKKKSVLPLMDHVHWQSVYDSFSPDQRKSLGVDSPKALKSYFTSMFTDPEKTVRQQLAQVQQQMGGNSQINSDQMLDQMVQQVTARMKQQQEELGAMTWKIDEPVVLGPVAEVPVTIYSADKKERKRDVEMINVEGSWKLKSLQLTKSQ